MSAVRVAIPLLLLAFGLSSPAAAKERPDPLDALLDGVATIAKPGVPGPIALTGDDAFAVVAGDLGAGTRGALVAASTYGRGRVVAFGHSGYLSRAALREGDTGKLVLNSVAWAARGGKPVVGLVGERALGAFLAAREIRTRPLAPDSWDDSLADLDVLVLTSPGLGGAGSEKALLRFVEKGGGVITAGLAWGWMQLNPDRSLNRDHRLNAALVKMGLFFADGYVNKVVPPGSGSLARCHAVKELERLADGGDQVSQALATVGTAYRWLPEGAAPAFRKRVRALAKGRPVPTAAKPVRAGDARERLAILVAHVDSITASPADVAAAPSAVDFPGPVPKGARRVDRVVRIDLSVPGWAGTGLYAPAGEVVRVECGAKGLRVRIGCHTDRLWAKPAWKRHPEISRSFALAPPSTEVASPHGGLLYVEVPAGRTGEIEVRIDGAVESPRFKLGETSHDEWRKEIRARPAPWAEFEAGHIVLSLPSEVVREIEDPRYLLEFWDDVLGLYALLGMRPLPERKERMVPDRQISAGYLHSGYPIMMQLHHGEMAVSLDRMRYVPKDETGAWGFWHELGHNHQRPEWTFDGTVEVTCNLFSLFVDHLVREIEPKDHPWPKGKREKALAHVRGDRSFARWKKDPGIALWTYIFVQEEFGWKAFREAFAAYAALPANQRPKSDADKRDQWLIRLSRAVDRDLGPYFEAWGIPVSAEARAAVAELDPWMPDALLPADQADK